MIRHTRPLTLLSAASTLLLLSPVDAYKVYNHDINDQSPSNFAHSKPDPRFARSTVELSCIGNEISQDEVVYREYDSYHRPGVVGAFVNQKHRTEGTIGCCPDNVNGRPYGPGKICCGDKIRQEVEGQFCCVYDNKIYFEEDRWRCDSLYVPPSETPSESSSENDEWDKSYSEYDPNNFNNEREDDYENIPPFNFDPEVTDIPLTEEDTTTTTEIQTTSKFPLTTTTQKMTTAAEPISCPQPGHSSGHYIPQAMVPTCSNNTLVGESCGFICPYQTTIMDSTGGALTCGPDGQWQGQIPECCQTSGCPSNLKIDFFFIIDKSSSIGETNFGYVKEYVNQLIHSLPIGDDRVRIGLITYNSVVKEVFSMNQFTEKEEYLSAVDAIDYHGKGTQTGKAIYKAATEFLVPEKGDRPDVPNFIILLTDGRARDPGHSPYRVATSAPFLQEKGTIVAIGVGDEVRQKELQVIAGPTGQVFMVADFRYLRSSRLRLTGQNLCPKRCLIEGDQGIYYDENNYGEFNGGLYN